MGQWLNNLRKWTKEDIKNRDNSKETIVIEARERLRKYINNDKTDIITYEKGKYDMYEE